MKNNPHIRFGFKCFIRLETKDQPGNLFLPPRRAPHLGLGSTIVAHVQLSPGTDSRSDHRPPIDAHVQARHVKGSKGYGQHETNRGLAGHSGGTRCWLELGHKRPRQHVDGDRHCSSRDHRGTRTTLESRRQTKLRDLFTLGKRHVPPSHLDSHRTGRKPAKEYRAVLPRVHQLDPITHTDLYRAHARGDFRRSFESSRLQASGLQWGRRFPTDS